MSANNENEQQMQLDLGDSFFDAFDNPPGQEYFKYIDERVNSQIAQGMKKAIQLLVTRFDTYIQKKMLTIAKEEFQKEFEQKMQEMKDSVQQSTMKRSERRDRSKSNNQGVSTQPQSPERKAAPGVEIHKERDQAGKVHHVIKKEELGLKYEAFNPLCNSEGSFQTDTKVYSRASNGPAPVQNDRYSKDVKVNIELSTVESQKLDDMSELPSSRDKNCGINTDKSATQRNASKKEKLVTNGHGLRSTKVSMQKKKEQEQLPKTKPKQKSDFFLNKHYGCSKLQLKQPMIPDYTPKGQTKTINTERKSIKQTNYQTKTTPRSVTKKHASPKKMGGKRSPRRSPRKANIDLASVAMQKSLPATIHGNMYGTFEKDLSNNKQDEPVEVAPQRSPFSTVKPMNKLNESPLIPFDPADDKQQSEGLSSPIRKSRSAQFLYNDDDGGSPSKYDDDVRSPERIEMPLSERYQDTPLFEKAKSQMEVKKAEVKLDEISEQSNWLNLKKQRSPNSSHLSTTSIATSQFAFEKYQEYDNTGDAYGMNQQEKEVFGDRQPESHDKIRIISKSQNHLYWLTQNKNACEQSDEDGCYFITQQIPKDLYNYDDKIDMLEREQDFYNMLRRQQGMANYVFVSEGIINADQEDADDLWSCYRVCEPDDVYDSLQQLLFKVSFNPKQAVKMYQITHNTLYELLVRDNGIRHIAMIMQKSCEFLELVSGMGYIYGNLRAENIIIQLNRAGNKIEQVKFINFGSAIKMENAANIVMPEQLDHFPPELLKHYIELNRFCQDGNNADLTCLKDKELNLQFMQSCASFDVFSLGVIILQIICGFPSQAQLPTRFKCQMVNGKAFMNAPAFGCCNTIADEKYVSTIIKLQQKVLNNLDSYLQKNDRYNICQDKDFYNLLKRMLSKDYFRRPDVKEILQDTFVKKWVHRYHKIKD